MAKATAPDKTVSDDDKPLPVLYKDPKQPDAASDFTIKVENKPFYVHRKTITEHSEYFRAMLEHDTKENQQGYVEVKEVKLEAVEKCIAYMYSGNIVVENTTVEDIFQVADMWQLSNIQANCIEFLKENLNSSNFASTLSFAMKYSCSELQDLAQEIYDKHIKIKFIELLQLSTDDFITFLITEYLIGEVAWDVIINWIKHDPEKRNVSVLEFLKLLTWDYSFPKNLLQRLWNESLIRNDLSCREFLFKKSFLDLEKFKEMLNLENYFILTILSREFKCAIEEIKESLVRFLKTNFFLLSRQPEFKHMEEEEYIDAFTDEESRGLVSEMSRWNAMMTWVNHDRSREVYFPALMKSIRFDRLPKSFLESVVRNERLITRECFQTIMNGLFSQVMFKTPKTGIFILYSDGTIKYLTSTTTKSWEDFKSFSKPNRDSELFFFNGKICLINGWDLFYFSSSGWINKRSMPLPMRGIKKIATLGDFIYVTCGEKLLCYNSLIDIWNRIVLPHDSQDITSLAAMEGSVYASSEFSIYAFKNENWTKAFTTHCSVFTFSVALNQKIYFFGESGEAGKFDMGTGYYKLNKVLEPNEERGETWLPWRTQPTIQAAFDFNDRLAVVCSNKIYLYDDLCENWTYFVDVPCWVKRTKGNMIGINMISACSFYPKDVKLDKPTLYFWNS